MDTAKTAQAKTPIILKLESALENAIALIWIYLLDIIAHDT